MHTLLIQNVAENDHHKPVFSPLSFLRWPKESHDSMQCKIDEKLDSFYRLLTSFLFDWGETSAALPHRIRPN